MKKRLYLVRHGETLFNKKNLVQGWCDSPLTELGIAQAKKAGKLFEENHLQPDVVYSSPSLRARNTALYALKKQPILHDGLMEMNFGDLEGDDQSTGILPFDHQIFMDFFEDKHGESRSQLQERIQKTLFEILVDENVHSAAIFSHGVYICEIATKFCGIPFEKFTWDNGAIHIVDVDENGTFTYVKCLSATCA
jgi:probable phosphoglycerate mutase